MRRSPVYKALNKPLTILGVDRRLFFAALSLGAGIWNMFNTISGALVALTLAALVGRWITQTDPQLPRIVLNSGMVRDEYDPLKSE
jgi:type IV secretory pathway TrbD component